MRILLVYHFFYPDSVISAKIFSNLAENLVQQRHQVTVFTANRLMRGDETALPVLETWHDVKIRRFARPPFSQKSNIGRLLNSAILQLKWIRFFFKTRNDYDAAIVGTDPQFSYLMIPFMRLFRKNLLIAHWCFDLYPEAIMASYPWWIRIWSATIVPFAWLSYRCIDIMADLGPLMCRRLHKYHHRAETLTIMPWAVVEPASIPEPDSAVRRELFGDAKLGILYSGTVGKAHNLQPFIQLARECRKQNLPVGFCFAGYGNRYDEELSGISTEDTNITRAGFVSEDKLQARLAAADIHMVSIADGWEGIVLPSKIFGALAMGRSLLYCGNQSGIVATLINQWHCGVVLDKNDIPAAVEQLKHFIDRPAGLQQANSAAFDCYHRNYSKSIGTKAWNNILKETSKTLGKIVTADIP